MPDARRGDLWLIDLGNPVGHEQGYRRPALVVSHEGLNRSAAELVIVIPVTGTLRPLPSHVEIETTGQSGLTDTSYAQVEQVRAISAARLVRRLGAIDPAVLASVAASLRRMLDL